MAALVSMDGDGTERKASEESHGSGETLEMASDAPAEGEIAPFAGASLREGEGSSGSAEPRKRDGVARFFRVALERGRELGRRSGLGGAPGGPVDVLEGDKAADLDEYHEDAGRSGGDAVPTVRLPGERDSSTAGREPGGTSGSAPLWRRPAFAAVAALALGGGALGAYLSAQGGSGPGDVAAASAGPGRAPASVEIGVVAPAAKLALVPPREPGLDPVREPSGPAAKGDQIEEITSLRESARTGGLGAAVGAANPRGGVPTGNSGSARGVQQNAPHEVGVAAPVRREADASPVPIGGKDPARVEPEPAGGGTSGRPDEGRSRPPEAGGVSKARDPVGVVPGEVTEARSEVGGERGDRLTIAVAKAGEGEPRPRVVGGVAPGGSHGPETAVPGAVTQLQDTKALGLVTELGALLARTQQELAALKVDHQRLRMVVEAKLGDLDHRLTFAEAKASVGAAKEAAASLADSAWSSAGRLPVGGGVAHETKPAIVPAKAVRDAAEPIARDPALVVKYRVQAASPGLAMLAEVGRSGGQSSQLQVEVGDHVAGYGKVTRIVQRGTEWVVQTDRGSIQ